MKREPDSVLPTDRMRGSRHNLKHLAHLLEHFSFFYQYLVFLGVSLFVI